MSKIQSGIDEDNLLEMIGGNANNEENDNGSSQEHDLEDSDFLKDYTIIYDGLFRQDNRSEVRRIIVEPEAQTISSVSNNLTTESSESEPHPAIKLREVASKNMELNAEKMVKTLTKNLNHFKLATVSMFFSIV